MEKRTKQGIENKKKYDIAYNKENTKMIGIRFHKQHDKPLLDFLKTNGNVSQYIKELIRADMEKRHI